MKIGSVGLGKMGSGICANIQKHGDELTVFNRTAAKTAPFLRNGAAGAESPRAVAERADMIFSSLMDDASVLDNCLGADGLLAGMKPGSIHVGLTTILPATADRLAALHRERGCHYVAAPVLGRPDAAAAGQLVSILAGPDAAVAAVRPIAERYSARVLPLGDAPAQANALKVCANYVALAQLVIFGEVFSFAEKSGLDKDLITRFAAQIFGEKGAMIDYVRKIRDRDFDDAGFALTGGLKDALLFESAFVGAGVRPGMAALAKDHLLAAKMNGLADKDWAALTEVMRLEAGLDSQAVRV